MLFIQYYNLALLMNQYSHQNTMWQGPNVVEEGTTNTELGKNSVNGTTIVENVVDEGDNLNEGTTIVENVVDEGDILDKGIFVVENVVDE